MIMRAAAAPSRLCGKDAVATGCSRRLRRLRPLCGGFHIPSEGFGGVSPERKGAQAMAGLLTFAAASYLGEP